ncbi:MAG: helix-turn-helix transcriptional regulator [Dehalococcoidales bacterium]|nr:helix-turn-helix transcriptional regulator [Dehalococcoidales bacterium]
MVIDPYSESLGQRIKMKRRELRITQEELATQLGVSPQHVSAIEVDRRLPSLKFLARLAEHLEVTTDYLITGKHPATGDPIVAIMGDDSMSGEAKRALISIIMIAREAYSNPES